MSPVIALSLLVAYLLVAGEVFLATAVRGVFRMSFGGVGPTELRILLAIGTIALRNDPHVNLGALGRMPLFDFGWAHRHRGPGCHAPDFGDAERGRPGAARAATVTGAGGFAQIHAR